DEQVGRFVIAGPEEPRAESGAGGDEAEEAAPRDDHALACRVLLLEEAPGHFVSSHTRTVLSRLPDRPSRPSGETATPQTQLVWPRNRHTSCPVATSHNRTVPS